MMKRKSMHNQAWALEMMMRQTTQLSFVRVNTGTKTVAGVVVMCLVTSC
jgi:hypothetical protein